MSDKKPSDDLRKAVYEALPDKSKALMDKVERFGRMPLQVRVHPTPLSSDNPESPGANATHLNAEILLPPSGNIDPRGITHELLHIHRFWVEKVPQVIPLDTTNEGNWSITGAIDNILEHRVIVPLEAQYGFDPFPERNAEAERLWRRLSQPDCDLGPDAARRAAFLTRAGEVYVPDEDVRELSAVVRKTMGIYDDSEEFARELDRFQNSKRRQIAIVLDSLKIPAAETRIVTIDIQGRKRRVADVPERPAPLKSPAAL